MKPLETVRRWLQDGTIDERDWASMSGADRHQRLRDLAEALPDRTPAQEDFRNKMLGALQRNSAQSFNHFDPFRGNGWAGHYEHYTPEVELRHNLPLSEGAELWRYEPDGRQTLLAKWDGSRWLT